MAEIDQIFHIKGEPPSYENSPQRRLFYLQPGVPNPFSYESRVRFFRFRESLSGAPENLSDSAFCTPFPGQPLLPIFSAKSRPSAKSTAFPPAWLQKPPPYPKVFPYPKVPCHLFQSLVKLCLLHGAKPVQNLPITESSSMRLLTAVSM